MANPPRIKVLFLTKWPPERCGVSYYSKDLCTALSKHICVSLMGKNEWRNNDPLLPFKTLVKSSASNIVHFQHEYLLYGHPYYLPIFLFTLAVLRLKRILFGAPLIFVTMHSTIKIEEMTRELWRRHRCTIFAFRLQRFLAIICMRILGSLVDEMIVHTSHAKDVLANQYGFSNLKVKVIPHGLWPKSIPDCVGNKPAKKLLIFGFFRPTKRYVAIIRSLRFLPETIHLHIRGGIHPHYSDIGFASYKEVIELVRELRLENRVHVEIGFVDKAKSFGDADVVILPYSELYGASGALCDAVAFNKPVLASDLPNFRSLLPGYRWLADIENVGKLAKTVIDLMDNYHDALKMINVYRKLWSWEKVAQMTLKTYEEVLLKNGK